MNILQCDMLQFSLSSVGIVLYVMDDVQFIIFHGRFAQCDGSFSRLCNIFFQNCFVYSYTVSDVYLSYLYFKLRSVMLFEILLNVPHTIKAPVSLSQGLQVTFAASRA